MNKREYLKSIRYMDELINEKLEELDRLRTLATKVNCASEGERVQTSGAGDTVGDTVAKIVDLQNEINADIDHFIDLKAEIKHKIDSIPNNQLRLVMEMRYLSYKTYDGIADELGITRQWVITLHNRALNYISC